MAQAILIVDDDPVQRRLLEAAVTKFGYAPTVADNGEAAVKLLTAPDGDRFQLVVLDLVMPELDGMGVLSRLRQAGLKVPVIVQTAHGGIDTVVGAMRAGAVDFVVKPVSPERLQVSIENALKLGALEGEIARMKKSAAGTLTFRDIVTRSPALARVIALGERAAKSQIPILIEGESGVGKELVARAIQGTGDRRAKPFITVNCGAIPEKLAESILFGHEKGAFTGAVDRHVGKFQEAHGGTLFLDEVGELPPEVQVRLLRALQDGEIDPVGAKRPIRVDFRLISATNRSLADLVTAGAFREDLYYRLNVFPIRVPPLRERPEDIPELARHFTARFAAEEGKPNLRGIDAAALDLLSAYRWPGNVRQLENAVFRAVVLADGPTLTTAEFPQIAAHLSMGLAAGDLAPPSAAVQPPAPTAPSGDVIAALDKGEVRPISEVEADLIRLALDRYGGRMALAARRLGIGRSTLYRKLRDVGIAAPDETGIAAS
ncbi:MAG: sigma-54-dependent Fis family transcriptional regulator [Bauldia sp.]|nr:sigma-54-dependent Fis family transcriptional regulator [Bauldia sp.]